MTRLVTCGWETGDITELGSYSGNGAPESVVTSVPTPRTPGTYCWKTVYGGISTTGARLVTLPAAKTDVWVRFGLFLHGITPTSTDFLQFIDSAGGYQGTVYWSPSDQLLRVYRGLTGAPLLGTSVLQFSADQWHTVEVRWQITSATVGIVELWVDDTRWLNLTGVDNTASAVLDVQRIRFGTFDNGLSPGPAYMAFDDLAINDTVGSINNGQIHDGRVVALRPSAAGSNTGQTRGGTDTGANWSQTSEVPTSMTQYVASSVVGTRDTYALANTPAGTWTVNAVEVLAYAQNSDSGVGSLGVTVKSGATTNEGTAQNLAISPQYFRQLYETDPNTSAAWTVAAVDALEAGTTVR